jgi:hypothetical protein
VGWLESTYLEASSMHRRLGRDDDKIKPAQHQHSQLTHIRLPASMRCYCTMAVEPSALDTHFLDAPLHILVERSLAISLLRVKLRCTLGQRARLLSSRLVWLDLLGLDGGGSAWCTREGLLLECRVCEGRTEAHLRQHHDVNLDT